MLSPARNALAVLSALALAWPLPALAASAVRGQAQAPVRMEFRDPPAASQPALPEPAPPPAAPQPRPKAAPRPVPKDDTEPQGKFPNIDTAKNRQDYEISSPKSQGVRLGRDEDSGDTVMGSTPQKKPRQNAPDMPPIEVRPILPAKAYGS